MEEDWKEVVRDPILNCKSALMVSPSLLEEREAGTVWDTTVGDLLRTDPSSKFVVVLTSSDWDRGWLASMTNSPST